LVFRPARPIAEVLVGELPAFDRIGEAILEPADLLGRSDMQKTFRDSNSIGDHHSLELIDLVVASLPLSFAGKPFYPFDQNASVPRAIEHHNLPRLWQLLPKPLEVVPTLLVGKRRSNWIHFEAPRIHRPSKPPHDSTLASRVPPFKYDNCSLSRSEIGLL